MQEGLLWFDDSTLDLPGKVRQAATRYQQKFGIEPDTCYVNDVPGETQVDSVRILPLATIRPHHFWIGRESPTTIEEKLDL